MIQCRNSLLLIFVIVLLCTWKLFKVFKSTGEPKVELIVTLDQLVSGEPLIAQDDPLLIDYVWKHNLLLPPSNQSYNLKAPDKDPSRGQGQLVRTLLNNMENGFFVEAGALDGETRSNTLDMERTLNWTGLLIEGDPKNFAQVKTKNRKAWISNTCLAVRPQPHMVEYLQSFNSGKILSDSPQLESWNPKPNVVKIQCMPLFTLLSALNITKIDFFSLDVEGSELLVLKTIPFDKVFIKTLSIEFEHTAGGKKAILDFMSSKGFSLAGEITPPRYSWANDVILVNNKIDHDSNF